MFRLTLLLLLLINSIFVQAQNKDDGSFFELYSKKSVNKDITIQSQKDSIFIIRVSERFKITQVHNLKILKRLSANEYIVLSTTEQNPSEFLKIELANSLWKASDNLILKIRSDQNEEIKVQLLLKNSSVQNLPGNLKIISINNKIAVISILPKDISSLLDNTEIQFAETIRTAHEELVINNLDLSVNEISAVHKTYPALSGNGIKVSLKEAHYDENDLDLLGRSFSSAKVSDINSTHATIMATLLGGNGNSYINGLGVAPEVSLTSSDYANLSPDDLTVFTDNAIALQNHSYGTGIENYYGIEAKEYDEQLNADESLIHVFSAGNSGTRSPTEGLYTAVPNRANLTGTFKQAKNVLVVAGTNRENTVESLGSKGPAFDGRIKPELVSAGEDGTSGAAALTSGVISLLQQDYKNQIGNLPPSALIKSVLINSADDVANLHPDFESGFGKLNALEAVSTITENRFLGNSLQDKGNFIFEFQVPDSVSEFKTSLVWNDPAAEINANTALVNDLDMWIEDAGGNKILPWVLNSYPNIDSLNKEAIRGRDSLNNAEQVSIENPLPGNYSIHVRANHIKQGTQQFYLSYQLKKTNKFEWTYPQKGDQLFAGKENYLRWNNSFGSKPGTILVSYDNGTTWTEIGVTGTANYLKWNTPAIFSKALLKVNIDGKDFISQPFSISKPPTLKVGFNCTDEVLLYWPKQAEAKNYSIYTIRDNKLILFKNTTDTTLLIKKSEAGSDYFAVNAQNTEGTESLKSFTININNQGVGCYVQALLASVAENKQIELDLRLGSVINLQSITWQKLTSVDTYTSLGNSTIIDNQITYTFFDSAPKTGIQYYRAVLKKTDGTIIYSDPVFAIYLSDYKFTFYPNPATESFSVLAGSIDDFELNIYNSTGQKIRTEVLNNLVQSYSITNLKSGIYICVISLKGKVFYKGKLIKN